MCRFDSVDMIWLGLVLRLSSLSVLLICCIFGGLGLLLGMLISLSVEFSDIGLFWKSLFGLVV